MKLTTTFNKLKLAGACGQAVGCNSGYDKLSKFLGGADNYGKDKEINLLTILESNGFKDTLWCLIATLQKADNFKRMIACDFAESVLHIFESKMPNDYRPRKSIETARNYAQGLIGLVELKIASGYAGYAALDADATKEKKDQLIEILRKHLQDE